MPASAFSVHSCETKASPPSVTTALAAVLAACAREVPSSPFCASGGICTEATPSLISASTFPPLKLNGCGLMLMRAARSASPAPAHAALFTPATTRLPMVWPIMAQAGLPPRLPPPAILMARGAAMLMAMCLARAAPPTSRAAPAPHTPPPPPTV
jgi:hypothetical protein